MRPIFIFLLFLLPITALAELSDTDGDGYLNISTFKQLRELSENESYWDKNIELDCDINCRRTKSWFYNLGKGWQPIGNTNKPFSGNFNGNGFAIKNLNINRLNEKNIGLFGVISSDNLRKSIKNLSIIDADIAGNHSSGLLSGQCNNYTVMNCCVSGQIQGEDLIGGLFGSVDSSQIQNCIIKVSIEFGSFAGGFCGGFGSNSKIKNCSVEAEITYSEYLFWWSWNQPGEGAFAIGEPKGTFGEFTAGIVNSTIENCFFIGSSYIPKNEVSQYRKTRIEPCNITNCYSVHKMRTDSILSEHEFARVISDKSVIENCFWAKLIYDPTSGEYKSLDKTTSQMKNKKTYIEAGWDFENIWDIDPDKNDGYPFLRNVPLWGEE